MSLFFVAFFHDYGLTNVCFTNSCQKIHQFDLSFNRRRDLIIKVLACIPVFGQIIGFLAMVFGAQLMCNPIYEQRVLAASLFLRGFLTFLGLGILCLILDIIITIATIVKNCIKPAITLKE